MRYILITFALCILELFYFKLANKFNIIDKPNHRSAHTEITLRGGGIIFWFASLLYFTQHIGTNYLFFLGITLVSLVSFWDDIQNLPNKIRILVHFSAISLIFYNLNIFEILPWWGIPIAYILAIGIINAYNFMDGINGITGLYTIVVMGALLYVNQYVFEFIDYKFIVYPILASIVFLFFNYRKKAKCFAGDVGSISIAFWIIYLLLKIVLETKSLVWLLFLAVYGVETVCTILHRIYLKENIFEAHRWHLYQVLSNGYKIDHRLVSVLYAVLQALASCVIIFGYRLYSDLVIFSIVVAPLVMAYTVKFYLLKKINY
jgi:UDP-N-acetylmuramyl pentapeptide phosphotransferase/UDP-N-acetylglucosamine-1-phosphate transferase